jgi:endonuclease/exonuclease/phosphatase family metal-dependent hydrolase
VQRSRILLRVALGCALALAVTGGGGPSGSSVSLAREVSAPGGSTYALMQMNLCLSGFARCYGKVAYPAGVEEAVARIRHLRPDAVTLNETCRADVAQIARRTGYHLRFSPVTAAGRPLRCVRPGGRGRFGDAVLAMATIEHADSRDFAAQAGVERRRWLCVTTGVDVEVCTAHLVTRSPGAVAANDAQCAELTALLERRAPTRTVIFGGDVNRSGSCAPARAWTRTDASASQAPGLQSAYGNGALRSPRTEVIPATHTDHDVLLVRAHRQPAVAPPSTGSVAPVTKRASSLSRKATNAAISSGPATRPLGFGADSDARSTSGPTPSSSR